MQSVLVDSNILLDLFNNDPTWAVWSEETLEEYASTHKLLINPIIYTEVSIKFVSVLDVEYALRELDLLYTPIPKEALFLAGKAFVSYRQRGGSKASPLPDFSSAHMLLPKVWSLSLETQHVIEHIFPLSNSLHHEK